MKTIALVTAVLTGSIAPAVFGQSDPNALRRRCAEQELQIKQLEKEIDNLHTMLKREMRRNGNTNPTPQRVEVVQLGAGNAVHVVKSGDTLSKISRQHKVSLASLMRANSLNGGSILRIGQKITIPGKKASLPVTNLNNKPAPTPQKQPVVSSTKSYKIVKGDTLYGIARRHKTSVTNIVRANPGMTTRSTLRIGQVIQLTGNAVAKKNTTTPPSLPPLPTPPKQPVAKKQVEKKKTPLAKKPAQAPKKEINMVKHQEPAMPKSIYLTREISFADLAKKHGTTVARLNTINGWDYLPSTILARGSEIYIPVN